MALRKTTTIRLAPLIAAAAFHAVAARAQVGMPEVVVTPVAHVGEPTPGIPGAWFDYFLAPRIDAAGNVALLAYLAGPEIDESNYAAIFYGPPGDLELIAWQSQPAPDMGGEIILSSMFGSIPALSETGWIAFLALLSGPGIEEGVNSEAIFVGPPGDIRKVIQQGDQAPGLDPGITIGVYSWGLGNSLSDNGTLLVIAHVAGPGVNETNDHAMWVGPRDGLQLVWREGMPAPGTEPDVTFDWADLVVFNDLGQVAFRGGLEGPGIDETNNKGRWLGAPGSLELMTRRGDPAPGFPEGVTFKTAGGALTVTNSVGDSADLVLLEGGDISTEDDLVLFAGPPSDLAAVTREGDTVMEAGPDVEVDTVGNFFLNAQREIFYWVRYQGPSIDDTNWGALYYGPFQNPQQVLRDGDPAPGFPADVVVARTGAAPALTAMNDAGDVLTVTEIAGPDVMPDNEAVLWLRDHLRAQWYPLLRGGYEIVDRTVWIPGTSAMDSAYCEKTGGSDGEPQSLNDEQELAIRVEFTDGTHGVYMLRLAWPGDDDGDGDVDLVDLAQFQRCFAGAGGPVDPSPCGQMDVDEDEDVDFSDFTLFAEAFTGSR